MTKSFSTPNVSRETCLNFEKYFELIQIWNRETSLIQIRTLNDFWERHILDSLQLKELIPNLDAKVIDLGTGAGFPGMVLAMVGFKNVTLVESNKRKTIFLAEVSRLTNTSVHILNDRIESVQPGPYEYIVSRACTDLKTLLGFMMNVSRETKPIGLFLKGRNWKEELEMALLAWSLSWSFIPSKTSTESGIIRITDLVKLG